MEETISFNFLQNIPLIIISVGLLGYLLYMLYKLIITQNRKLLDAKVQETTLKLNEEKKKLEIQKYLLENTRRNLTDSIRYAERIQKAILPTNTEMQSLFEEFFILFKPRDIVSGDFYWVNKRDNLLFLAAVDCTGHGVPGAFTSLIGFAMLEQIVEERHTNNPAQILEEMDKLIVAWLRQNKILSDGLKSRDGMDMSILKIDTESRKVTFAGAKSFILVRQAEGIVEYKGDSFAIGGVLPEKMKQGKSFTNHTFELPLNNFIYLTSDGYVDQFGGENNRKFSKKRLKEELAKISDLDVSQQESHLNTVLENWMGKERQIDDIMLIGIKP